MTLRIVRSRGCSRRLDSAEALRGVDSSMTITADVFEAFLKCPTKCYLRSRGEVGTGNAYADWLRIQNESWHREAVKRLTPGNVLGESVGSPPAATDLEMAQWHFAVEYVVRSQNMESRLHAVERILSEGRSKPAQFIPIRFIPTNKISRDKQAVACVRCPRALGIARTRGRYW
jgi:hypothetical protein